MEITICTRRIIQRTIFCQTTIIDLVLQTKNIIEEDYEYSNKKMGRSGDPFLYALLFKFTLRNLPKALMPNIQIDVGQINVYFCANKCVFLCIFWIFNVPTPSKIAKMWGIIFCLQHQRHLWGEPVSFMPNVGPKWQLHFLFEVGLQKGP